MMAKVWTGLIQAYAQMAKHRARKGKMVPPEERLKPLMVAAPAFAVAFFWLGWTAYPSINVVSPLLAVGLIGLCILWMFLSIFNYLIDACEWLADTRHTLKWFTDCSFDIPDLVNAGTATMMHAIVSRC